MGSCAKANLRTLLIVASAIAILIGASSVARADDHDNLRAERLIRYFNFEDEIDGRKLGEFESLPFNWYVIGRPGASSDPNFLSMPLHQELIGRPGFPRHGVVRFDKTQRTGGEYSFYIGLNGGSSGAFLQAGAIPAVGKSNYLVAANVRTTDLKHARARLIAYFIDRTGRVIESSVAKSAPIVSAEAWTSVTVQLYGEYGEAAWIGMQLEVVQPNIEIRSPLGNHQVVYHEVEGGAWFDDVAVWQLPSISLETQSKVNVLREPLKPTLSMRVRDLTGKSLVARTVVYGHQMNVVAQDERPVGAGEPERWQYVPELKRYGWFLADMKILDTARRDDQSVTTVARKLLAFTWLPKEPVTEPLELRRFLLGAEDATRDEVSLLSQVAEAADLSAFSLGVWENGLTGESLESRVAWMDDVLFQLGSGNRRLVLSIAPTPDEMVDLLNLDASHPVMMFDPAYDESVWRSYLTPFTLRYGQNVSSWQMGSPRRTSAFFHPDWNSLAPVVNQQMESLVPQPHTVIPWHIARPPVFLDGSASTTFALAVPQSLPSESVGEYLKQWPTSRVRVDLATLSAAEHPHQTRIVDFVLRMLYAWEAGVDGIGLNEPWARADQRDTALVPDPLLGVYSVVAHRLAGKEVVNRLALGPGLDSMILYGSSGGTLVAWNREARVDDSTIDMYLGPNPVVVDVFGNRRQLPMKDGRHQLTLTRTPVFIEGIDTQLAVFRTSFQIDEPFLESTQAVQKRTLTVYNPWPQTITGQMRIVSPEDWDVQPRIHYFSIPSGGYRSFSVNMQFPVSETAGHKRVTANFRFAARDQYNIEASTDVEIGLSSVEFDANLALAPNAETGGTDALVTQIITNRTDRNKSFFAYVSLAGHPRVERVISELPAGQTVVRRFRIPNVQDSILTNRVRAGIRESNGPAALNMVLDKPSN